MNKECPRVLVSSVDVWNKKSGSDTFQNMLSGYDWDKIANVYIRNGKPTSEVCNKYFLISENAVVKSVLKKNTVTGMKIQCEKEEQDRDIEKEYQKERKRYSFFSKHRWWLFIYIREVLWKFGKWQSKELDEFVMDFNPEVLFFPIESYIHFNRINEYLIKKTNAKAIGIIWDDNFTYKVNPYNLGFRIHRYFLKKSVMRLLKQCDKVFAICPKMQFELEKECGINADLLTKGAKITLQQVAGDKKIEWPLKMVYTGKLNYGRIQTVQLVADELENINQEEVKIEFDIYSGTELNDGEKALLNKNGVFFKGFVTQNKISGIQRKADILLVAEALKGKHKYDARLSFSTKIVDYLMQGKCIMAIGPDDIAPIAYLKENDAALVATDKNEIKKQLDNILEHDGIMSKYGEKAFDLALKKHDLIKIQEQLYNSFKLI